MDPRAAGLSALQVLSVMGADLGDMHAQSLPSAAGVYGVPGNAGGECVL
jgi:hypothetical protein